ncbi:MAG: S8 family serine peptidase, partial [Cyclobacteriaceae bacterium]|nr:S8 family serine peptidase [Cyclobacteriaceae bacterium]
MNKSIFCVYLYVLRYRFSTVLTFFLVFLLAAFSARSQTQELNLSDFVLLSGNGENLIATEPSGYVEIGSSSSVYGGSIGSFGLVRTTGTVDIRGNVFSLGTISLNNSNSVSGKIAASNNSLATGIVLSIGSNSILGGNIDVNGNIIIDGGIISGQVTHPIGTTYSGPIPVGGNIIGEPTLPIFPALPTITNFPAAAEIAAITSSTTITPGAYGDLKLNENQTITLNGTGVYVFNLIDNKNGNTLIFDFKDDPTGKFLIYVHNNAQFGKVNSVILGGGSANRIFTEVHGTGFGTDQYAFDIANGSGNGESKWEGTVWAPYAGINIGSGTGSSSISGALLSGTQVNIQSGVSIFHAPYDFCVPPIVSAGLDVNVCAESNAVILTAAVSGGNAPYSFLWSNGMTTPSITVSPDVTTTYSVTVSNSKQPLCNASDSVVVTVNPPITVSAGIDANVCFQDNTTTLTALASGGSGSYSYEWFGDGLSIGTGASIDVTPSVTTNYYVVVTDSFLPASGMCSATDEVLVTYSEICPYYKPPENGKTFYLIGAELTSLAFFYNPQDSMENNFIYHISNDNVLIDIISNEGQTNALLELLRSPQYGLIDEVDNGTGSLIISGYFPIANLLSLNELPELINHARPVYPAIGNSEGSIYGVVRTKGDISMRADLARLGYDLSGKGIKVGVLSDSYNQVPGNKALANVSNHDLTDSVHVLKDSPFGGKDEGRAMLQIVHDIAPEAELAFRTGIISPGDFANGIRELYADSCDIIVDDITYITEPFFQDGVVAQAVDFVASQGVSYFTSAGNFGSKSYEGTFNAVTAPNGIVGHAHDYGAGDVYQNITVGTGTYTIVLQWEDPNYSLGQTQTGTQNDLDIYLTNDSGTALFGFNRNNVGGDAIEVLPFTVGEESTTNIMIVRAAGMDAVKFKYIVFRGDGLVFNEHNSGNGTIVGQANAKGAMTVGAVLYSNTPAFDYKVPEGSDPFTVASFSSRGGVLINGENRSKPDFIAPNGVNTTVEMGVDVDYDLPNPKDGDGFSNFFGTSASAPHAAAVAALLMEGRSKYYFGDKYSSAEIREVLKSSA